MAAAPTRANGAGTDVTTLPPVEVEVDSVVFVAPDAVAESVVDEYTVAVGEEVAVADAELLEWILKPGE